MRAAPNERPPSPPTPALAPPRSPAVASGWLLRSAAFAAVAAGIGGVIVAPGLRGNAGEQAVLWAVWSSSAIAYFLWLTLLVLALWGGAELVRARELPAIARAGLVGPGAVVLAMSTASLKDRVPPMIGLLIAAAAAVGCLAGAYCAARAPHTRAIAGVLVAFAFAAIARLAAWELATRAGDAASMQLFFVSRGLSTAGVFLEAAGQLTAVTWLGTRGRATGQLACSVALLVAFALTWGVASGVHSGAALWQAVLHTALADAPGVPSPFAFAGLATFLVPASLLLALVSAAQPNQVVAIVATMALALVSRGSFDAPLRALCAVVASQWAALACIDERAMWRTLLGDRSRSAQDADGAQATKAPRTP